MPILSIESGETQTVAAGETESDGPINIDGTLNLDGTLNAGETTISAAASVGLQTRRPLIVPAGSVRWVESGGVDTYGPAAIDGTLNLDGTLNVGATESTPSGEKAAVGSASLGVVAAGDADGEKSVSVTAGLGLAAVGTVDSITPLRRVSSVDIDNDRTETFDIDETRRSDFSSQGTGDVDDG